MTVDGDDKLTGLVIGAAIAVHRELGPGIDEIACEEALSIKLTALGTPHVRQLAMPLCYKGVPLDCGYRLDLLVDGRLPLELKAADAILPIHEAQLLTYMRLGRWPLGLLINFDVAALKDGIRRRILTKPPVAPTISPSVRSRPIDPLSFELIAAAIEVHRTLGPGLLRSAYEESLCHELRLRGLAFDRRFRTPLHFDGHALSSEVEVPLVVGGQIPVFCLSVAALTALHESRLLARMSQAQWSHGFLLNFNAPSLNRGLRRLTLK